MFDLESISSFSPLVAILVALLSILFAIRHFKLDQHRQKKNRLIDEAKIWDNEPPSKNGGLTSLRSAIYDFCGKEGADLSLALLCLNSRTPGLSLEHFRIAGHLFKKENCSNTWLYIGKNLKWMKIKHKIYLAYFLVSFFLFTLFLSNTPVLSKDGVSLFVYASSLLTLLFFTIHGFIKTDNLTDLLAAIMHLNKKLHIS